MIKMKKKIIKIVPIAIISFLLMGTLIPSIQAVDEKYIKGFEAGPSYNPVIPMKKATFIGFDKESLLDDYGFLAAIPTSVFSNNDQLYAHPLLFYEEEYDVQSDEERSLNTWQGIDYFMQDWQEYCGEKLDQMTLVNVEQRDVDIWGGAKDYVIIKENNPYDIASSIALQDWSYSDNAVVAVIEEEFEKPTDTFEDTASGTIDSYDIKHEVITADRPPIGTGATDSKFEITDRNYKYVVTKMSWKEKIDYDLQLFDDNLGMVQAAAGDYKEPFPYEEIASSYIHNYGDWLISVSAVPKKGTTDSFDDLKAMTIVEPTESGLFSKSKNTLDIELYLYPGSVVDIKPSSFGVRDVNFNLQWDNPGIQLGMTLLDPVGTEIASTITKNELKEGNIEREDTEIELHIDRLGECREDETYSMCVFSLNDLNTDIDFTIDYNWKHNFSQIEGDCLAGATNGAVLASSLNAPLLYTSTDSLSETTKDVLYTLGVENIYLVNFGSHLSSDIKQKLSDIANIKRNFEQPKQIYDCIRETTGQNDVIFSTIDPWNPWLINKRVPEEAYEEALHIGPAALVAAHHGSPVLIVDIHPLLSQASTWATDWWIKNAVNRFVEPSAGSLTLSGRRAYEFLEENDFGKIDDGDITQQDQEVIITVAGQFEIGTPWDRSFTGAGLPGRFWSSPVDSAYAICRNMFYPAMIFVNPGMETVTMEQGSSSTIPAIGGRIQKPLGINLVVHEAGEQEFQYPVLQTYNTYQYRFNEKASKHWNFLYQQKDGVIPYLDISPDPIDDGAALTKSGRYYPDQSESEVIPFYCDKAGYDSVYSTNFDYVTSNLNKGVLIWVINSHGMYTNGGMLGMWDPENPYVYEENPWRAYEPVMYKPGHLRTYLHWLPYHYYTLLNMVGMDVKILKTLSQLKLNFQIFPEIGCTENPDVCAINPQLIYTNQLWNIIKNPTHLNDLWGAVGVMVYRDRLKEPLKYLKEGLPLINWYDGDGKITISPASGSDTTQTNYIGTDFDDALDNLHSCGINTISCLPANTYLHLTWMRHGTTYQIIDPWTTTDWSASWTQMLIKRFAMGDTIGEAYERGMRACGPQYTVEGGDWWDTWENVCLFGDPNLRVYVPNTEEWDNEVKNKWDRPDSLTYNEDLNLNGHTPFGATEYPHEKEPVQKIPLTYIIIALIAIILIIAVIVVATKRKKKK